MKILGISRSPRFSPNSVARDEAIFMAVASRLQHLHHEVSVIGEDLFIAADLTEFDLVFSMARGRDVVMQLAEAAQNDGLAVVNDPTALLANNRATLVRTLGEAGIPLPAHALLSTNAESSPLPFPLWLKRGDACAQEAGDVVFVEDESAFHETLRSFQERGIQSIVAEEHRVGSLVKFYGVEGSPFFFTSYADSQSFSKFGLESHNQSAEQHPFDEATLKLAADRAARASGLIIYGGDAVVGPDGNFVIIDFNDWPSFSACRKAASRAIAQRLTES